MEAIINHKCTDHILENVYENSGLYILREQSTVLPPLAANRLRNFMPEETRTCQRSFFNVGRAVLHLHDISRPLLTQSILCWHGYRGRVNEEIFVQVRN